MPKQRYSKHASIRARLKLAESGQASGGVGWHRTATMQHLLCHHRFRCRVLLLPCMSKSPTSNYKDICNGSTGMLRQIGDSVRPLRYLQKIFSRSITDSLHGVPPADCLISLQLTERAASTAALLDLRQQQPDPAQPLNTQTLLTLFQSSLLPEPLTGLCSIIPESVRVTQACKELAQVTSTRARCRSERRRTIVISLLDVVLDIPPEWAASCPLASASAVPSVGKGTTSRAERRRLCPSSSLLPLQRVRVPCFACYVTTR
jgi:hypothetical protein